jgi:hypothetical protein
LDSHNLHDVVKKDDDFKKIFLNAKAMSIDCFIKQRIEFAQCPIDETLPNFIKRKHPRKGEKRKRSARTRVQASKRAPKRRATGGKWNYKY